MTSGKFRDDGDQEISQRNVNIRKKKVFSINHYRNVDDILKFSFLMYGLILVFTSLFIEKFVLPVIALFLLCLALYRESQQPLSESKDKPGGGATIMVYGIIPLF